MRIAADGELISVDDARHPRSYHLNALANVRDFDFDFGAAFRAAKKHPRLALQDRIYESKLQPHIRAAYHRHKNEHSSTQAAVFA